MEILIEWILNSAHVLAGAAKGSPVTTTFTIFMFYVFFVIFEATVEKLIFGDRFEHWADPFFIFGFIAYSAYAVYACAAYNEFNK